MEAEEPLAEYIQLKATVDVIIERHPVDTVLTSVNVPSNAKASDEVTASAIPLGGFRSINERGAAQESKRKGAQQVLEMLQTENRADKCKLCKPFERRSKPNCSPKVLIYRSVLLLLSEGNDEPPRGNRGA